MPPCGAWAGSHKVTSDTPLAADPEETTDLEERTCHLFLCVCCLWWLSLRIDDIKSKKRRKKSPNRRAEKKKKKVRRAREATAGREDKAFFGKASWPITVVQDCPTELGAVVKDHDQTKRRRTFITTNNLLAADPGGHDGPQASPEGDTTVCGQHQHQPSPAQGHGLNPARPDGANSLLLRFS